VEFDPTSSENKLCYTTLFDQYNEMVEASIAAAIEARYPGTTLEDFEEMVVARPDQLMVRASVHICACVTPVACTTPAPQPPAATAG